MTNAEIQVGEYVRTHKGIIAKVLAYEDLRVYRAGEEGAVFHSFDIDNGSIADVDIKSHSKSLIDLIEVGDYVNGLPVRFVENGRIDIGQEESYLWLKNEHIVSVVTHEQFSSMEYRVGGE